MAEVIKSQMERVSEFETPKSPGHLRKIYWAVSKFGKTAWNGSPHPVEETSAVRFLTDAFGNLPLLPVLGSLKAELTIVPDKPEQKGSRTPQP